MKKVRNIILVLLMFVLTVSGLTLALSNAGEQAEVADAASATSVTILGETITSRVDLSVKFADYEGTISGYASFANGVLTLENVKIQFVENTNAVIYAQSGDLEIVLVGENILDNSAQDEAAVIKLDNGTLTLSGAGSLKISSTSTPIVIYQGNLVFSCASVDLSNSYTSIRIQAASKIYFKKGGKTKIHGGMLAISNFSGEAFLNDEYDAGVALKTGSSESYLYPTDEYTGEKFVFAFTNAELSSANNVFDKYKPKSIIVTMTLNGNDFHNISGLNEGSNYSVSGNTVTLYENCFAYRNPGNVTLQFIFSPGNAVNFTVSVVDNTPITTVTLSINEDTYNADFHKSIETVVSRPDRFVSISSYSGANITEENYHYEASSGRIIFDEAYIMGLPNGTHKYMCNFSMGALPKVFTLNVINSKAGFDANPPTGKNSYITPVARVFDKYTAKPEYADLVVTATYNGNSLVSIQQGLSPISYIYIIRVEDEIRISLTYLNRLEVGEYALTFIFSDGDPQVLTLVVKNTDPLPNNKSPHVNNPLAQVVLPGLGGGNTDTDTPSGENTPGATTPELIDGSGDTAALMITAIFGGISALSLVVWIILRKKRIV